MYERCREAYWAKGKGQRARGVVRIRDRNTYLFIQRGRLIFCIMQSAHGSPIAIQNIESNSSTRKEKNK